MHGFLAASYWATGIPLDTVRRAVAGSFCVGAFAGETQVGFARAVTDRATFAYLADVFVLPEFRRRGIAGRLTRALLDAPELQGLRRWVLLTRDAHAVYAPHGFKPLAAPERYMERHDPEADRRPKSPLVTEPALSP